MTIEQVIQRAELEATMTLHSTEREQWEAWLQGHLDSLFAEHGFRWSFKKVTPNPNQIVEDDSPYTYIRELPNADTVADVVSLNVDRPHVFSSTAEAIGYGYTLDPEYPLRGQEVPDFLFSDGKIYSNVEPTEVVVKLISPLANAPANFIQAIVHLMASKLYENVQDERQSNRQYKKYRMKLNSVILRNQQSPRTTFDRVIDAWYQRDIYTGGY